MTALLKTGQTLIFLGDHTSPDDLGYVSIIKDVLARFHPRLQLRLISAGSRRQTAAAIGSQALTDIITSSKPDWLIVGIGLADAFREPIVARTLNNSSQARSNQESDDAESTFGPELRVRRGSLGPISDVGHGPEPQLDNLASFERDMTSALKKFGAAGISVAVLTTLLVGTDAQDVINEALKAYNKAIRTATQVSGAHLIDIEKSCRDLMDRATNYKQAVAVASPIGDANAQGQALLARVVLDGLGILPTPGWRPFR